MKERVFIMAKTKVEVLKLENGGFLLNKMNLETGQISDSEKFDAEKVIDHKAIGTILNQEEKAFANRRRAWQSFLSEVFILPMLDGWKGKGDRKNGKVPKEYKASVRDAETEFLRQLVKEGSLKLHISKNKEDDDNEEKAFQRIANIIREDKNYSNIKSTVIRYFFFVGERPADSNGILVPPPVMLAELANVMEKERKIRTVADDLSDIVERIKARQENPSSDTVKEAIRLNNELGQILGGLDKFYAELATQARVGHDSSVLTKDAIGKAQAERATAA